MFDRRFVALALASLMAVSALAQPSLGSPLQTQPGAAMPVSPCAQGSATKTVWYDVTAFPLPISYNSWGDLDLEGRLMAPRKDVDPILADVTAKLEAAGLGTLAAPLADMRAALAADDVAAATEAAAAFVEAAAASDGSVPPHARITPTPLVQPLVLRAHVGDCVVVNLTNTMPEPASLHVHAVVAQPGMGEALAVQQADFAQPGQARRYTMFIPAWESMEGAHFLHSHADSRQQTRHGLFGAIVAEPQGSTWLSTREPGVPAPTGLEAMIVRPGAPDYREFVKIYHDEIELVNWKLESLREIDQYHVYGPGTKGINLRTEPFMDRFQFHDEVYALRQNDGVDRKYDKSQSYGSYTYGDPATWIQESYVGDPVKFRVINAGPGQYHIHHLHGGGIRWKSTPLAEDSQFALGRVKDSDPRQVQQSASQRLDVQNMGPGESYNLEPEGGTGGVQQSAGDFLYHCHIAEHYLAGMWGIWRAYNTLQPGLLELPDRIGHHLAAVNSAQLVGRTVEGGVTLDEDNIAEWVESYLPARGVPGEEDASVWNWAIRMQDGLPVYLGEPETAFVWPNYPADAPGRIPAGERPEIGFDPLTGKPAYPMLRPHFGERPPFAPEHGGSPFLKRDQTDENPGGLCPDGAPARKYDMVAIQQPVKYNKFDTDIRGQVFVRAEDKAAVKSGAVNASSVVLRANAGDCVDVTLVSELDEKPQGEYVNGLHTKTNIHIHLVQFDVQGSDGVVAGFNYETTLRSLNGASKSKNSFDPSAPVVTKVGTLGSRTIAVPGEGARTVVEVDDWRVFVDATGAPKVGSTVGLGLGTTGIETAKLLGLAKNPTGFGGNITLDRVLATTHVKGEHLGYEFVRYQWYPDVELGTVYFHDHVNGLDTWRHGLFGSLIVEPRGSKWLPPKRTSDDVPDDVTSHVVDIVPPTGPAYREMVLHFQDRACVNTSNDCLDAAVPRMPDVASEPAAFNMRAEPLHRRNADAPFWSGASWATNIPSTPVDDRTVPQGDPDTMMLEAYPGDEVVLRFVYAGQSASRAVGTFGITGHRFQQEQFLEGGRTTDTVSVAVSSQHNLQLECGAGGCLRQPGDYLYYMTQPEYVQRGAWGIMRVHDPSDLTKVRPLPGSSPSVGAIPDAPVRYYDVSAIEGVVVHNPTEGLASQMKRFVFDSSLPLVSTGRGSVAMTPPDPLVIRAHEGEIVQVNLTNRMPLDRVGLHAGLLSTAPSSLGFNVGHNPDSTLAPGERREYRWYADRELGAVDLVSLADPVSHSAEGLTGALVVEPADAVVSSYTGPASDIRLASGALAREHVLLFTSPDAQFQSSTMPYLPDIAGLALVNYATEPLARRMGAATPRAANGVVPPISGSSVSSCHVDSDTCLHPHNWEVRNPAAPYATSGLAPWTPIIEARADAPLVLRVVGASGDQLSTVHLDGHFFAMDPEMDGCKDALASCKSNLVSTVTVGPREVRNVWIPATGQPGDYMYRNHRDAYFEAGSWGLLRVRADILPEVAR